jgi:hypothetical protein
LREEEPICSLLAFYNNESLTHGTWLASLIIATVAFMGLALTSNFPLWELEGAFLILWFLGFLMSYLIGRLLYFSTLVTILTNYLSSNWFRTIRSTTAEVQAIHEKYAKQGGWNNFTFQFRTSFQLPALLISLVMGFFIAVILFIMGLLYLGRIDVIVSLSSIATLLFLA